MVKREQYLSKIRPFYESDLIKAIEDKDILLNFKIFYDFDMYSKDYLTTILIGQIELKNEISKNIYETLKQRIIVNYTFERLSREEVKQYVKTRLEYSGTTNEIFEEDAMNALYSCCKSSSRRLNTLIVNYLMLGCQNDKAIIDSEIVMNTKNEMDFKE